MMRLLFLILFSIFSTLASADIIIDVDTLNYVNSLDSVNKVYRIEISNKTDSNYLFFISPPHCSQKSASDKFKYFLRQKVGDGWKMMNIIYEGNMIYDSKSYSEKNLLKIISPGEKFVLLVLTGNKLERLLDNVTTLKMSEVRTILKTDLRKDLIYPYQEVLLLNSDSTKETVIQAIP